MREKNPHVILKEARAIQGIGNGRLHGCTQAGGQPIEHLIALRRGGTHQ
jgi:hypothetical protein